MYFAIVLLSLMAGSLAQIPNTGPCPEEVLMENFEPSQILGQWHAYAAYPTCDPHGWCRRTNFIDNGDGSMEIVAKQLSTIPNQFSYRVHTNRAQYLDRGVYLVTTADDPRYTEPYINHNMTVYRTDYTSFMVKGACVNIGPSSANYAWILTRSPNPSASVVARINEAISDLRVRSEYLERFNHTDCPDTY